MPLIKMLRSHKSTDGPPVQAHIVKSNIFKVSQIKFVMLTLFSMGGGRWGGWCKKNPYQFFPYTSTNNGISSHNFLTFSFKPFVTLLSVLHY